MSRVCAFCCKSIPDGSGENQGKQCLSRFVTLLERYLGGGVPLAGLSGCLGGAEGLELELGGCQQCLSILKSFCDAYHRMKCLELHVQWKVYTLARVMREAGRVPSRMRFLKEACGGNGDDFRNLLKMRNDTIETCSRGLRRCAPKVKLERLKSSERLSSESTPTDLCSKNQLFLSNWTCSFAAVLMLLSLSPDNPTKYHQERPQIEADFALDDVSLSPNELQSKDVTSEEIKCPLTVILKSETVGVSVDGSEIWIAGESSENHDYESSPSPYDNDRNSNYDSAPDNDECTELGIRTHTQTVCKEKPKLTIVASEDGSEFRNADGSTDNSEHETSSNDDWNSNSGSVHDVGESIELETGNLIACKEEFYEVGGEASHADNLEVIDNQATLDSKDFSKLAEAVPTTSGGRINTNSFRCTKCFKYFPKKHSLNLHVSKKHPEMRVINKPSPYSCELCVTGYSSYHSYLVHKRTFSHRQKLNKKSTPSKVNMTVNEKPIEIQALVNEISPADNDAKTSPLESEFQERIVETKYNLRTNRRYPIKSMDVESDKGVASSDDEDVASDFDSSGSLSSSSNVSIKSGNYDEIPHATKRRRGGRVPKDASILRCSSNTCKKYFTYFKKAHEEHMNLHKPGQYQCKFCEVIKSNAFDLSIHELKIHSDSKKPSRKRIGVRVYHCPRCEYFTQFRLGYTNHFAQQHLGFTRESRYEACPICQVKLIDHRQGSHFRRFHDITGVEPNEILKCTEENCTAYFTRKNAWSRHKREIHMEKALLQTCDDEGNQPDGKLHCQICARNFQSEYRLKIHKYLFHNKTKDPGSTKGIKTNHLGAFICPALECTKTFRRIELFDRHWKLHGSFKCHFCEVVKEYAPDLALHEMEQHSSLEGVKKAFKCSRCPFTSTQLSATEYVTHHLEAHQGLTDRFYSCGICKMRLRSNRDKRIHIIAYHHTDQIDPKAVERCDKCPAYFLTEKQLRRHKQYFCNKATKVLHPGTGRPVNREQYECSTSECVESFDNPKSLELHQKLHGSFKCQFCSTSKGYALDLAKHELEHVDSDKKGNPFSCPRCPYATSKEAIYLRHFVESHLKLDSRLHSCPICSASFFTKHFIYRHTREWHNTRDMDPSKIERCDQCPAYFIKKGQLLLHQRWTHNAVVDYRHLKCHVCDKSFKTWTSLRAHEKSIHGVGKSSENFEFEFECDLDNCKKRFRTKNELEWHKLRSSYHLKGKGQYHASRANREKVKCQECGKEYVGVNGLKCHMKVHRKDRPTEFKCDLCDKVFQKKACLQAHQKFHLGPDKWDFMCAICSKKCVNKYVLKEHMRTHSNEKPFVCQLCGEKYAHRHNLRNHVNTKHKEEGVQDLPRKLVRRNYVSRKGMKLTKEFCFTAIRDQNDQLEHND